MSNADNAIRFLDTSVKKGDLKAKVRYSISESYGNHFTGDTRPAVVIYADDYSSDLRAVFANADGEADEYKNDTDLMADYHDQGRVALYEDHPLYSEALKRAKSKKVKDEARWKKTQDRRAARYEAQQAERAAEMAAFKAEIARRKAERGAA